jgi:hypothetical protein
MNILSNFTASSIWIPKIVKVALAHSSASQEDRYTILKERELSLDIFKAILFYSYLFQNINSIVYYDDFNWIPISYDEVQILAYYGNTLDKSIIKDKLILYPNQFQLKLIS